MRRSIMDRLQRRAGRLIVSYALVAVAALAVAIPLFPSSAAAQFFGQNKVQYKRFHWRVLRTQHFDIHYYQGTEAAVNDAALMAERAYQRLSRVLHHEIRNRVPLVLYASHTDFEQTNITPELLGIGTGGVTEFLKRRVFLPFTGSYSELDHVMTHELVHAFQVDVLFGENQGLLGNPFAAQVPVWFMEGMAEYLSIGGIDPNTAMWLRDASLEGYLIPVRTLGYVGDIRVYRFGQSIFQFIADHYGLAKIGEILKKTRRLGSAERALEASTGLTIDVLSKKWTEAVRKEYLPQIVDHETPTKIAMKLTDSEHDVSNFNVAASVSPSGLQYVYISDRSMYNDVYLASALDGKQSKKLIEGERTGSFETLRFFNTAIAWSPDEKKIAIPAKVGGEDAIYIVEIPSGKIVKKFRFGLDAIYSPTWSPDGSRFAFVGLKAGRSVLYLADSDGKNLRQQLSGRYAVRDPVWSPDGTQIAYATDEGPGTEVGKLIFGPLRLAVLDVESGKVVVPPNQNGTNISPQWSPDGRSLLFVSDRTGIPNIYRIDLATGESVRLTDLLTGVSGLVPESPCLSLSHDGHARRVGCLFRSGAAEIPGAPDLGRGRDRRRGGTGASRHARRGVPWLRRDPGAGAAARIDLAAATEPAELDGARQHGRLCRLFRRRPACRRDLHRGSRADRHDALGLRPDGLPGAARGQHLVPAPPVPRFLQQGLLLGRGGRRVERRLRGVERHLLQRSSREPQHPRRAEPLRQPERFGRLSLIHQSLKPDELRPGGLPVPERSSPPFVPFHGRPAESGPPGRGSVLLPSLHAVSKDRVRNPGRGGGSARLSLRLRHGDGVADSQSGELLLRGAQPGAGRGQRSLRLHGTDQRRPVTLQRGARGGRPELHHGVGRLAALHEPRPPVHAGPAASRRRKLREGSAVLPVRRRVHVPRRRLRRPDRDAIDHRESGVPVPPDRDASNRLSAPALARRGQRRDVHRRRVGVEQRRRSGLLLQQGRIPHREHADGLRIRRAHQPGLLRPSLRLGKGAPVRTGPREAP
ncbi:MAG: hypothetical protein E6K79_01775 [Candidatus Eisenbacteria bacterium]|uniref:Peptidase S9 n=1 Tax=Eiseniibacteriota bacterium TaxID=2212470 RepID=A0A538TSQ8_UNCEI|nr:MAG: hypothetical protein E6K79_01775 [Candidatus Eisenbacteria bacterium]